MKSKSNLFHSIVIATAPIVILILLYSIRIISSEFYRASTVFPFYTRLALQILVGMVVAVLAVSIVNTKRKFSIFFTLLNLIIVIVYFYGMIFLRYRQTSPFSKFFQSFPPLSTIEIVILPLLVGFYLCMLMIVIMYARRESKLK